MIFLSFSYHVHTFFAIVGFSPTSMILPSFSNHAFSSIASFAYTHYSLVIFILPIFFYPRFILNGLLELRKPCLTHMLRRVNDDGYDRLGRVREERK
jgi:hypothetical protein